MTVFFISDLHLTENSSDSYNLFVKFLVNLPLSTKAIYIIGDLFELWIDDRISNQFINRIKDLLLKTTEKCSIYFIRGNRDFLIGSNFAHQTNITILPDFYELNLYNNKILLTHGDSLCTLDKRHIYFTKVIRHPVTMYIANILPVKLKTIIGNKIRLISKRRMKNNSKLSKQDLKIYDVCYNAVNNIVKKHSVNILIHGHTHKPNIYFEKDFTRIVLGDWHKSAKILVFNQDGYELKTICL